MQLKSRTKRLTIAVGLLLLAGVSWPAELPEIYALMQAKEMHRLAAAMYFRLLSVAVIFIALAAFGIRVLHKMLSTSREREEDGFVFSRAVLLAQENERKRISLDLHDTVAQKLRYLALEMDKIGSTNERDARQERCAEAAACHLGLISEVRNICNNLIPPTFSFQGLPDALRQLCLDFGKRTGIECRMDIAEDINLDFFNEEEQLQVFRIAQEALSNVEKHAAASEVIVILQSDGGQSFSLSVSDGGCGFDVESSTPAHLGLRSMNERAALLGGRLTINSERGEGTLVHLHLPSKGVHDGSAAD